MVSPFLQADDGRQSPPLPSDDDEGSNDYNLPPAASNYTARQSVQHMPPVGLLDILPAIPMKQKPPMHVVGDVGGKIAIIG